MGRPRAIPQFKPNQPAQAGKWLENLQSVGQAASLPRWVSLPYGDRSSKAGFNVQAWRLASSIMAGARKPRGKITQPHNLAASSATWTAAARRAGLMVTVSGGTLPSIRSIVTRARAFRYDSGGTGTLPNHTE